MEIAEFLMWLGEVLMIAALIIVAFMLMVLWMARQIDGKIIKEVGAIAQDLEEEKLIALTVEIDGDQFLCYNAQTMTFVCQGRSLEEIFKQFQQRFPTKSAAIYNGDESALKVLKQQLKELSENSSSVRSTS